MKKINLLILLLCCLMSLAQRSTAQNTYALPEQGAGSTIVDCSGTLTDHAGGSNYNDGVDGWVTIAPEGVQGFIITFETFLLEDGFDYLIIYEGTTTAGIPLFISDPQPAAGSSITLNGVSAITIQMTSDGSVNDTGFVLTWEPTSGSGSINAAFTVPNDLPVNSPIAFSDNSASAGSWHWDFGDGSTSQEANPSHIYTAPGTYTVTLTVANCFGDEDSTTQTITVQDFPDILANPTQYDIALDYGDSTQVELTITNNGDGDLIYNLNGAVPFNAKKTQILSLVNGADLAIEYPRTKQVIANGFSNYTLTELTTYNAAELEAALENKDILLVPEQESCNATAFASFAPIMQAFAENGGTIILIGTQESDCIFNTGLFEGSYLEFISGQPLQVTAPDDPLAEGVAATYNAPGATFVYDFSNNDIVRVIERQNRDIACYRNIGDLGKVIYIGHDYFNNQNVNANKVLINALNMANSGTPNWLYSDGMGGTLAPGESVTVTLEFNATLVYGGNYSIPLTIYSNDPDTPELVIPCNFTVSGQASFATSAGNIIFEPTMIGLTPTQTITISNPGTDWLEVTEVISNNPAFTLTPDSFSLYGGTAQDIILTFAPTAIQNYTGTITIVTNVGVFVISVNGQGVGAPTMGINPTTVNVSADAGQSTTTTIAVGNTGEGPLDFTVTAVNATENKKVLFYTRNVDQSSGSNYAYMTAALNTHFPEYELVTTNTNNLADLENALSEVNVFVIPDVNYPAVDFINTTDDILQNFMQDGGTVISGLDFNYISVNTGLFEGTLSWNTGSPINILNNTTPITNAITSSTINEAANPFTLTNDLGVTVIADQASGDFGGGGSVIMTRNVGNGRAIYLGFDFYEPSPNMETMFANAVRWGTDNTTVNWLSFSPASFDNVDYPNGSQNITLTCDATDLLGGVYQALVTISGNDPLAPSITIPVTFTVVGYPQALTPDAVNFGTLVIGETEEIEVVIDNPGTGDLIVTNSTSSSPDVTINTSSFTIDAQDSGTIVLAFTPTTPQNYNGTITLQTNIGDITINFTGQAQAAPAAAYTPSSITTTLLAGESEDHTIAINNSGQGGLTFSIPNPNDPINIMIFTYGMYPFSQEPANINNIIDGLYTSANITEFNSEDISAFENALENTKIVVIPNLEEFNLDITVLESFAPLLSDFMVNGGTVIHTGTYCNSCLSALGTLPTFGFSQTIYPPGNIDILLDNNPLVTGIDDFTTDINNYSTIALTFADNIEIIANGIGSFGESGDVLAYREIGLGKAIYVGYLFDQTLFNPTFGQIMENALTWAINPLPSWLSITPSDGSVATGGSQNLNITINTDGMTAGVYQYNLTITTNQPGNYIVTIPITLTVEAFPQAVFAANNTTVCGNGTAVFNDLSVNLPTSWTWDFGDGTTSNQQNPAHTYTQEGTYDVSLEVCNNLGCDETVFTDYITVDFAFIYCDSLHMPNNGTIQATACNGVLNAAEQLAPGSNGIITIAPPNATGMSVTFTQFNMANGYIQIYDGEDVTAPFIGTYSGTALPTQTGGQPGVIVATSGVITILQFVDFFAGGDTFTAHWDCIAITAPPTPAISYETENACQGLIQFADQSDNYPSEWLWDFGDGTTSTEQNPEHSYLQDGTYSVLLNACNFMGCNSQTFDVTVNGSLFVDFTVNSTSGFINLSSPTQFVDNTVNATGWQWNFGNGQTANNIRTPITVFTQPGMYNVTLTVTTSDGCTRTRTITFQVVPVSTNTLDVADAALRLQPNPANSEVQIQYTFEGQKEVVAILYDALGRAVYQNRANANNSYTHTIAVDKLPRGCYWLSVTDGRNQLSRKLILQ